MRSRVGLSLALCLGLASGLVTRAAQAESPPSLRVSLEYEVSEGLDCPNVTDFSARVVRQLGYPVFVGPGEGQRLRIEISRAGERTQARIEWFDRQQHSEGERRLTSDVAGCADLARSLAFAVAVQIQLHASALAPPEPEPSKPPESSPPPPPPAEPPPPPVIRPAPTRESGKTFLLGAGILAKSGVAPQIGLGARAFGSVATRSVLLELSAHAIAPAALRQADGSGFTAYELGASLAPCLRLPPLDMCAVGTASMLHVRGEGVDRIGTPSSVLAAAGGRIQLLWPRLGSLGVLLAGEVVAILTPRDVLLNGSKVWSTAPAAVTLSLNFAGIFE